MKSNPFPLPLTPPYVRSSVYGGLNKHSMLPTFGSILEGLKALFSLVVNLLLLSVCSNNEINVDSLFLSLRHILPRFCLELI